MARVIKAYKSRSGNIFTSRRAAVKDDADYKQQVGCRHKWKVLCTNASEDYASVIGMVKTCPSETLRCAKCSARETSYKVQ